MKKIGNIILILTAIILGFGSCSDDDGNAKSKFNIRLTDAPGDYAEVNIEIKNVQIHTSNGDDESGWKNLGIINPGVYNLLDFVNGKDTLLASDELSAGKVSQIRLVLGENNSLKLKDGTVVNGLKVPSGQQSGIKLLVNAEIKEGVAYNLILDFDAGKSIVQKGNGNYSLKPTIRTFLTATSGSVKGIVVPAAAHPYIQAIAGTDTFASYPDSTGKFLIRGLKVGTYKIVFSPADGFQEFIKENVEVKIGEVTDLQTVNISE